jgi:hypothetical protein
MQLNISSASPKSIVLALSPLALLVTALTAGPAQAFQFGLGNISGNSATNALAGQNQLFIDVTDALGGENMSATKALFKFSNIGPAASSITQINIDNSTVLKSAGAITDSGAGVDFSQSTKALNLAAGNTVNFVSDFSFKANTPVSQLGVNPSEWVSITFDLNSGKTLQSLIDDMRSGALRFGMHVQAFANGGSEAFVNTPKVIVPPPPVVVAPPPVVVVAPPPVVVAPPPVVVAPPPVVVVAPPPVVVAPPPVVVAPPPVVVVAPPPVVVAPPPVVVVAPPPVVVAQPPVVVAPPPVVVAQPPVVVAPPPPVVVAPPPVVVTPPPPVVVTPQPPVKTPLFSSGLEIATTPQSQKVPEANSAIGVILLAGRLALKKQRRTVVQPD